MAVLLWFLILMQANLSLCIQQHIVLLLQWVHFQSAWFLLKESISSLEELARQSNVLDKV